MPMSKCSPAGKYQNLFMTVPDRGFSKEDLIRFLRSWRDDDRFLAVAREPYANPKAGFTHHYHVGMCFAKPVRIGKLVKAANKSKHFLGMDMRSPLVAKGKSAPDLFMKYFKDPSKYKALDEHPMLVRNRGPPPPVPNREAPNLIWGQQVLDMLKWKNS